MVRMGTKMSTRVGHTRIPSMDMDMRTAGSKMSVGRTGMGLVWRRVEEEEVSDLGE